MFDFMEYCLLKYYKGIRWSQENYYSAMNSASRPLLLFSTPNGLSLTLGKSISTTLKSSYTVGLPNTKSTGWLATSIPLDIDQMHLKDEMEYGEWRIWERVGKTNVRDGLEGDKDSKSLPNAVKKGDWPYLWYGRLFQDGHLEGLYTKLMSKDLLLVVSGVSSWAPSTSHVTTQIIRDKGNYCTELTWSSDLHLLGVSGVYNMPKEKDSETKTNWSFGSEVYYTGKENSGGFSLGGRYTMLHDLRQKVGFSDVTLTINPMMGHIDSTYTTTVTPALTCATKYEFNAYSLESDVAIGIQYATDEDPIGGDDAPVDNKALISRNRGQLFKIRFSPKSGLALKLEGVWRRCRWSFGVETEFNRIPNRRFGIEVQIS